MSGTCFIGCVVINPSFSHDLIKWKEAVQIFNSVKVSSIHWGKQGEYMYISSPHPSRKLFKNFTKMNYNLGQNKKEQLTPFPPKAMMKAREDQNPPF